MFRRCLSALLIGGYIAGQLAATPHAHGAGAALEHARNSLPHFHSRSVQQTRSSDPRYHSHGPRHHGHCHSAAIKSGSKAKAPIASERLGLPNTEHDADAVYVPAGCSGVLRASESQSNFMTAAAVPLALPVWESLTPAGGWSSRANLPGFTQDNSGLYLALRQLRI